MTALYFTHKKCYRAFGQSNPGLWGAIELDCLFVYLANNLNLDWKVAKAMARMFE
jgi:hypothetical protein